MVQTELSSPWELKDFLGRTGQVSCFPGQPSCHSTKTPRISISFPLRKQKRHFCWHKLKEMGVGGLLLEERSDRKCVKVHLGDNLLNRLRQWGWEEAGGRPKETAFDKAELSGTWTNSSSLGREEKGFVERVYETSSMCSEVMHTANTNTVLPLCFGCHSPRPSAPVIYLSGSKLQWALSGHHTTEAGLFGGTGFTFTSHLFCFGILFWSLFF